MLDGDQTSLKMTPRRWTLMVWLGLWTFALCPDRLIASNRKISDCITNNSFEFKWETSELKFTPKNDKELFNQWLQLNPSSRPTSGEKKRRRRRDPSSDCCFDVEKPPFKHNNWLQLNTDNGTHLFLHEKFTQISGEMEFTLGNIYGKWEMSQCINASYNENACTGSGKCGKKLLIYINITEQGEIKCYTCRDPDKRTDRVNVTEHWGNEINTDTARSIIEEVVEHVTYMTRAEANIHGGEGVTGIISKVKNPEDIKEIVVGLQSLDQPFEILSNQTTFTHFKRTLIVPKEAFQQSIDSDNSDVFAAFVRFRNMSKDVKNSTLLNNEVFAIDMNTTINNLTEKICIIYNDLKIEGIPVCSSWNGKGSSPVWTADGCDTETQGDGVICSCSHLTFFAVLLVSVETPLNETLSATDLTNLTIITRVGCSLSMIFLAVILFIHFLLRRTKASDSSKILMHLVCAMFMLNLCFLVNDLVASLGNSVGCKIMGATMHYFLLATFTWFAVHAFHLCLHMYTRGMIQIKHYQLKVSIPSWGISGVAVIVLLATGKYGEQVISADYGAKNVTMCWLTNNDVHLIVNIGYYSLVFLFTFTTFIVILTWVVCLKKTKTEHNQANRGGVNIVTIMGLCCMLGITWGFAFFAHGPARIVFYYVFTVLNSFQGFFLFIYYYKNSKRRPTEPPDESGSNTTSVSYGLHVYENPYNNQPVRKTT